MDSQALTQIQHELDLLKAELARERAEFRPSWLLIQEYEEQIAELEEQLATANPNQLSIFHL